MLDTVLGSCVSACIRNPRLGIGGMNHFMLPRPSGTGNDTWESVAGRATRYGTASMEQLINRMLSAGGTRADLEVKIFGGGRVLSSLSDIGNHNVDVSCATSCKQEGLKIGSEDVGDTCPRHVQYFPRSGRVRVRHLTARSCRAAATRAAIPRPAREGAGRRRDRLVLSGARSMTIKVLVVDDSALVRKLLTEMLSGSPTSKWSARPAIRTPRARRSRRSTPT